MSAEKGVVSSRPAALRLADGVVLRSRFWHPNGEGPWPALLMRQPYGSRIASTVTYAHPSWWASHGFLVVVQDARGQGESEGRFRGFGQEAADTSATHAWVRQLPECNGRLGVYGFSYQGPDPAHRSGIGPTAGVHSSGDDRPGRTTPLEL